MAHVPSWIGSVLSNVRSTMPMTPTTLHAMRRAPVVWLGERGYARCCRVQAVRSNSGGDKLCIPNHNRDVVQPLALASNRCEDRQGSPRLNECRQRVLHVLGTRDQLGARATVGPESRMVRCVAACHSRPSAVFCRALFCRTLFWPVLFRTKSFRMRRRGLHTAASFFPCGRQD